MIILILFLDVFREFHNVISHLMTFPRLYNCIIKIGESNTKNGCLSISEAELCGVECVHLVCFSVFEISSTGAGGGSTGGGGVTGCGTV